MAKKVNIPVAVTGDDEAKKKLQQLGGGVEELGEKAERKAAPGARKAAEGFADFDNKAEKLAKSLLGQVDPALAQATDLLFDMIEGVARLNPAMLGIVAIGVLLGGVARAFATMTDKQKELEEQTKKTTDALRKQRDEALSEEERVRDALQSAGILGRAQPIAEQVGRLTGPKGAIRDREAATFAAIAGEKGFTQLDQIAGAFIARGRKDKFTGNIAEDEKLLRQMAVFDPELATAALGASNRDFRESADRAFTPPQKDERFKRRLDTLLDAAKKNWHWMNDADKAALEKVAREIGEQGYSPYSGASALDEHSTAGNLLDILTLGMLSGDIAKFETRGTAERLGPLAAREFIRQQQLRGTSKPLGTFIDAALDVAEQAAMGSAISGSFGEGIVRINIEHKATHVNTQFNNGPYDQTATIIATEGYPGAQ
ncbi:hypothetical protein RAS1_09330 [Phycisphaerae bacterium RAS1]|nr:hypothetical protein RAS1_09330 [Phycisphaerae bacterium RAS1]